MNTNGHASRYVRDLKVPELGLAAGFGIFGFRALALGQARRCAVVRGFDCAFGSDGPAALAEFLEFVRVLGGEGRRPISLAKPGCISVTADELSFLAAFAATQQGDAESRDAHLTWLFARTPPDNAALALEKTTAHFGGHGLWVRCPATTRGPDVDLNAISVAGTA